MRSSTKFRLAALAVFALLVIAGFYLVVIAGPGLKVTRHDNQLSIEPYFLEYNLGVSKFLLEDIAEHRIVAEAVSKPDTVIDAIHLAPGLMNPISLLGPNALLVHPSTSPVVLVTGRLYRITIWGNNGFGSTGSSTTTVRL